MHRSAEAYADVDHGLFEPTDLLPPLQLATHLYALQEAAAATAAHTPGGRATHAVLDLYTRWRAERADRPVETWRPESGPARTWGPSICGPSFDTSRETCHPVIFGVDLRCWSWKHDSRGQACTCLGDLLYRHGCAGCGHLDPARDSENAAAEDAMDHTWGRKWRWLPILACSMPDDTKKRARWLTAALEHYPDGWLEAGGPVLTARSRLGSRHVPGRTPYGGYDLAAIVSDQNTFNHHGTPGLYRGNSDTHDHQNRT